MPRLKKLDPTDPPKEGYHHLSWEQIDNCADHLVELMREQNFKPDCLIGITVGGLIPLGLLAEKLGVREIYTVSAHSYQGTQQGQLEITSPLEKDLSGKRALLVDEIAETGNTLRQITIALRGNKALELKTATLAVNSRTCTFLPDFYSASSDKWIVFPWEKIPE